MRKIILVLVSFGLLLGGCGTYSNGSNHANANTSGLNTLGGAILGGVGGGIAGNQIGGGTGKIAATIGGTILGAMLGAHVGSYLDNMDRMDRRYVSQTLENVPSGRTTTWQNPDSRTQYNLTPVNTYQAPSGNYCREFTTEINVAGRMENVYGTACRMPDGSWQIVQR